MGVKAIKLKQYMMAVISTKVLSSITLCLGCTHGVKVDQGAEKNWR